MPFHFGHATALVRTPKGSAKSGSSGQPIIRGTSAAASLKQAVDIEAAGGSRYDYPRHFCRGLIEAAAVVTARRQVAQHYPRHFCRGLIEASLSMAYALRCASPLPRHFCRGLIEASRGCRHATGLGRPSFRGIFAAASLKRCSTARAHAVDAQSIRGIRAAASLKRLIKAADTHVIIRIIPRHSCRGLIEAHDQVAAVATVTSASLSAALLPRPH